MTFHRISHVEVVRYPILRLTFDDGLSGEYDLGDSIAEVPVFAPLKDEAFFRTVATEPDGRSIGWNLDRPGAEIDLCADAMRIHVEVQIAEELAERYARRRSAAE